MCGVVGLVGGGAEGLVVLPVVLVKVGTGRVGAREQGCMMGLEAVPSGFVRRSGSVGGYWWRGESLTIKQEANLLSKAERWVDT